MAARRLPNWRKFSVQEAIDIIQAEGSDDELDIVGELSAKNRDDLLDSDTSLSLALA